MFIRKRLCQAGILISLVSSQSGCRQSLPPNASAKPEVAVAAAANLTGVFQRIGPRFEAQTGIHAVFSFGSTAQLATQIENAAPFDLFMAADAKHVDDLDRMGLLASGTRAVYARGILALWIPAHCRARLTRIEGLTLPEVRFIAVAKPELAPYGQAAVETLQHLGIWDQVKSKIVYAANINTAKQYGASGNADAVFTAYSLVLKESDRVIPVDETLHQPIDQELGIVANCRHPDAAGKFVDFMLAGEGRDILVAYGYMKPQGR